MPETTLTAHTGREIGTSSTRRLRADGKIPGVVYGHGSDPIPVAVVAREFQVALSGEAGLNTLLSLEVGDSNFLTLARDIQHHPFKNVVTHVDFQIVRRDEVISAEIPINLIGEALEVQHGDGIVDQQLFTLQIKAKPADIPPSVDLDISELTDFPEMLDGRVKTLHPKVHGGLLFLRDNEEHRSQAKAHEIEPIDLRDVLWLTGERMAVRVGAPVQGGRGRVRRL